MSDVYEIYRDSMYGWSVDRDVCLRCGKTGIEIRQAGRHDCTEITEREKEQGLTLQRAVKAL